MDLDIGSNFVRRGNVVVVVLGVGDKSTQARDIELAKSLERELQWLSRRNHSTSPKSSTAKNASLLIWKRRSKVATRASSRRRSATWPAPATLQRSPETLACREKRS